jgi:hypothetical protein
VTQEQEDKRRSLCIHEAGHALVGWALKLPLDYMTIYLDGTTGVTRATGYLNLPKQEWPTGEDLMSYRRDRVAFAVAGEVAQFERWVGEQRPDAAEAIQFARLVDLANPGAVIEQEADRANRLLETYAAEHARLTIFLLGLPPDPGTESYLPSATIKRDTILEILEP